MPDSCPYINIAVSKILNNITMYIMALMSVKVEIASTGKPMCIGTSAKTAAAKPFGMMNESIAASAMCVFLLTKNLHKINLPP